MDTKKIVVVGSSNTDMVIKSEHLPKPGETVLGGSFSLNPGGKGANQAVAAARLGGDVIFVAKVGDDSFGEEAIKRFQDHGIDTRFVGKSENCASGIALIMVDGKGENCISVASGANESLKPIDIDAAHDELVSSAYLLTQLESPLETIEHLGQLSSKNGLKFVLNPAPARPLTDELLRSVHILTPNQVEAELLSGTEVSDLASARRAAQVLRERGINTVIITMGSRGAYVLSDELDELIPACKAEVIDTTAAGDTFNGALVVGLSEGMDLRSSIEFANRAAAYSVGIIGAQASTPLRSDIE